MYRSFLSKLTYLILLLLVANACDPTLCTNEVTYYVYDPIFRTPDVLRNQVLIEGPRKLSKTGNLYVYRSLLIVGEPGLGIHIYDNSDPKSPIAISFIALQGNKGLSVRNDILYADNYTDLYLFDISAPNLPSEVNRLDNVFMGHYLLENESILVDYKITQKTIEADCGSPEWFVNGSQFMLQNSVSLDVAANQGSSEFANALADLTGTGGSLAKFTIANENLYTIDDSGMEVFDISDKANPVKEIRVELGWGIETIFPYQDFLFFGSQQGMFIYNISNPDMPEYISEFQHARVCDPVFAIDDRAYVTLRNGTECEGFINQLDVIDITNIYSPVLITSFAMDNPRGLSARDENLFICDGDFGIKVFDRTDDQNILNNRLEHVFNIHASDVISVSSSHLIVVGRAGIFQFDSSDPSELQLLSHIIADND